MSKRLRSPLRAAYRGRSLRPRAIQPRVEPLSAETQPGEYSEPFAPVLPEELMDESVDGSLPSHSVEAESSDQVDDQVDDVATPVDEVAPVAEVLAPQQDVALPPEEVALPVEAAREEERPHARPALALDAVHRIHVVADDPPPAPRPVEDAISQTKSAVAASNSATAVAASINAEAEEAIREENTPEEAASEETTSAETASQASAEAAAPPSSSVRSRITLPDPPGASDEGREAASPSDTASDESASEEIVSADAEPALEPAAKVAPAESVDGLPQSPSVEDELSTSLSLSAEFFRAEEDSVPPFLPEEELDDPMRAEPPSPATLRRRRAFRGVVGTLVGLVGLCAVAVVAKTIATRSASASASVNPDVVYLKGMPWSRLSALTAGPAAAAPPAEPPKAEAAAQPEAPTQAAEAIPAEATTEPAKVDEAKTEEAKTVEAKSEEAKPAAPAGDAKALLKETLGLLNRGKLKDAIPVAQAAIAADPGEAMAYLYLGSALQDTGKWKDGIEAYSECVRKATKGPVHECRAMGGRK